jgi:hypothetical protein
MADRQYGTGAVPSPPDPRDYHLDRLVPPAVLDKAVAQLPPYFRRAASKYPVFDQGSTPMCVGYSGVLGRTIGDALVRGSTVHFDPADLYQRAKERDGLPRGTEGTYIRAACAALAEVGAVIIRAGRAKRLIGQREKITAYARLRTAQEVKLSIYLFGSTWVGREWPESWFSPEGYFARMPKPSGERFGHAFTLVGWNDKRGVWVAQNSWGQDWGRGGRAEIPYEFMPIDADGTRDPGTVEAWRTVTPEEIVR